MCLCRNATLKAYEELRKRGDSEDGAYEAAVRIYRHHHPERPRLEAYSAVADWLEQREVVPQESAASER